MTIPKQVRDALGIEEGDQVVFRVEGYRATLARTPDLLELEGAVSVPAARRGASWDEARRTARNVYVLESFYDVPRERVAELVRAVILFPSMVVTDERSWPAS